MIEPFKGGEGIGANELYAMDRSVSEREGVTKEILYPYFYKGSKKGVLLIHGFAGSPKEVEPLFSVLKDRGLTVYASRVAGHGTTTDDMNTKTYEDWYNSLMYGYFAIKNSCDTLTIIGQSNGGLLASLAAIFNPIDSLCLLAPAFKARNVLLPLVRFFHKVSNGGVPRFLSEERREFNYDTFPLKALYQMMKLEDFLWPRLEEIKVPAMLSVSKADKVISSKAAQKALRIMGSYDKTVSVYDNKKYNINHIMTEEHLKDSVLKEVADWIGENKWK